MVFIMEGVEQELCEMSEQTDTLTALGDLN